MVNYLIILLTTINKYSIMALRLGDRGELKKAIEGCGFIQAL